MTQSPGSDEVVKRQIEMLRRKLLDLTMRNRMLNYRPSKRLGIEIEGEDSYYLHRLLVDESKKMSFVGRPDPSRKRDASKGLFASEDDVLMSELKEAAEDELNAFLVNPIVPVDQLDTKLNTAEFESVLQTKLRTMQREAHEVSQGLGINTLFLTLAMLEWSEDGDRVFRAPLLFIPVRLEKQKNGAIRLQHDGSDVGANLPLRAKLAEFNIRLPEWDEEKGVAAYLAEVESTIRLREDWHVIPNQICLGFFNYEKYAMYVDLGGETWPNHRKPWENADLLAMFGDGYRAQESSIDDETFLDDFRPVEACREVFDADSSQTIAMIRAAEGLSIVVEGPPGTGKSQTITNIIAEAVGAGKTVLFVSAKRAALDVVHRNLERAELTAACLDLHDKLTNRKEFYAEIKSTVEKGVSLRPELERVARLTELRDRLNAHSSAANEPVPEFGCTPFEGMANLARLPAEQAEDRPGRIPFESLRTLKLSEIQTALPLVRSLQVRLGAVGVPEENAFWGANIDYLDPALRLDLEEDIASARRRLALAFERWQDATEALQVEVLPTLENVRILRICAERALEAPSIDGLSVKASTWRRDEPVVRATLANLRSRNEIRLEMTGKVRPEIWERDVSTIEAAYAEHAGQWFRFVFGSFRAAQAELALLLTASLPPVESLNLIREVRRAQLAESEVSAQAAQMGSLFGVQWRGLATDPAIIERLLDWVLELHEQVERQRIPSGFLDFFSGNATDPALKTKVEAAEKSAQEAIDAYSAVATQLGFPAGDATWEPWGVIGERLEKWQSALPELPAYVAFLEARRQVLARGLSSVVEVAEHWSLASQRLTDSFLRSYFSGVVREAMQRRPELRTFEREGHEAAISEFQSLDDFKLRYNRAQIRLAHFQRIPTFDNAVGNLNLLKIQCELQRRHKPIRAIMTQAGEAIQRIKPVFMMSPLTVAIHLPPDLPPFDMVIFDEASQIKPEDALCAIARAKQCIVVGDTKQMPPTSFFDRLMDDEDMDIEEEEEGIGQEARKLESVLSLMSAVALGSVRRPDLRWHYRSIHPSLIQPSNEMFYGGRLIVFPSPGPEAAGQRIGLLLKHHPETIYEPGSKLRVNRKEAELVADRVAELVRSSPEESLLVAAMNKPQADLIYNEVLKRERLFPDAFEAYRTLHPHEPIDIKNLETVQGDERDVVLISVTYGRDAAGVIRQQFGPLLLDGGERRLNVLFTRARRRCEVFSNLTEGDIRSDGKGAGVEALKRFLKFAQTGMEDMASPSGLAEGSPFEDEVVSLLQDRGYEVHRQIGSEGYRIDLGVVDPASPECYVLGVECDGAAYHSARTARDRDKLRQRVLESRGWNLHRIWSHDWWQDRDGELRRLLKAMDVALAEGVEVEAKPVDDAAVAIEEGVRAQERLLTRPYVTAATPAGALDESGLARYLRTVVETEGPIHRDLLFVRLREALGVEGNRPTLRKRLEEIIDTEVKGVLSVGDAIYAEGGQLALARDWSNRPAGEKKVEFVTQAEIAAALKAVIRDSFGIDAQTASKEALRLMGLKRASEAGMARFSSVLGLLVEDGVVEVEGETLRVLS